MIFVQEHDKLDGPGGEAVAECGAREPRATEEALGPSRTRRVPVQRGSSRHLERVRRLLPHVFAKVERVVALLEVEVAAARAKERERRRWESIPGCNGLLGELLGFCLLALPLEGRQRRRSGRGGGSSAVGDLGHGEIVRKRAHVLGWLGFLVAWCADSPWIALRSSFITVVAPDPERRRSNVPVFGITT